MEIGGFFQNWIISTLQTIKRKTWEKKKQRLTSALWGDYMYKVIHSNIVPPFFLYEWPTIINNTNEKMSKDQLW